MRWRLIFLVPALTLFMLWVFVPRAVSAQDNPSTLTATASAPVATDLAALSSPTSSPVSGISVPGNDAIIAGTVLVTGTTTAAWTLAFSDTANPVETWFPLAQSGEPVSNGALATWDTSSLTDGFYLLRMSVLASDAMQDFVVRVRVNNYTSLETITPTLTAALPATDTPTVMITPTSFSTVVVTATVVPSMLPATQAVDEMMVVTPISLPTPVISPNPAVLDPGEIYLYLGKGILAVLAITGLIGLMFFLRRK
jgi:hypothetical protein